MNYKVLDGLVYFYDDNVEMLVGVAMSLEMTECPETVRVGESVEIKVEVKDYMGNYRTMQIPIGIRINNGEEIDALIENGEAIITFTPSIPGTYVVYVRPKDETHTVRGAAIKEVIVNE